MTTGISFENYLIKNEKYLAVGNETPGEHEEDGKISSEEIDAFFSSAHIDRNNEATTYDMKISQQDFNDWYEANEAAINAYYESIGLGEDAYGNEEYRDAMRDSMLEYMDVGLKGELYNGHEFDELKAEQLGLVDKEGVLGHRDFDKNGKLWTVSLGLLNETWANDDAKLSAYEKTLASMVYAGSAGNEDAAERYRNDLVWNFIPD